MWQILLYYKYVPIKNAQAYAAEHGKLCKELGLKGRILVADEGINGTVGGPPEATEKYRKHMHADPRFADMEFKTSSGPQGTFAKMFVRYRSELVTLNYPEPVDPVADGGTYIEPKELKELYDQQGDFVIVDMRNEYEANIGRFKNAVVLPMENFKQLPQLVDEKLKQYKDKKVVTYCTGGIRCEKATALLKKKGFKNVYQLHGGVHQYGQQFPSDYWEGKLYVFDERVAVPIGAPENRKIIAQCFHCAAPCDDYTNCGNPECNVQIIMCDPCFTAWRGTCSDFCKTHPRSAPRPKPQTIA